MDSAVQSPLYCLCFCCLYEQLPRFPGRVEWALWKWWSEPLCPEETCLKFSLASNTPSFLQEVVCGLQPFVGLLVSPGAGYGEGTEARCGSRQCWQRQGSPRGTSSSQPAENILLEAASQVPKFKLFLVLGENASLYWGCSELEGVSVLWFEHLSLSLPVPCELCPQGHSGTRTLEVTQRHNLWPEKIRSSVLPDFIPSYRVDTPAYLISGNKSSLSPASLHCQGFREMLTLNNQIRWYFQTLPLISA